MFLREMIIHTVQYMRIILASFHIYSRCCTCTQNIFAPPLPKYLVYLSYISLYYPPLIYKCLVGKEDDLCIIIAKYTHRIREVCPVMWPNTRRTRNLLRNKKVPSLPPPVPLFVCGTWRNFFQSGEQRGLGMISFISIVAYQSIHVYKKSTC